MHLFDKPNYCRYKKWALFFFILLVPVLSLSACQTFHDIAGQPADEISVTVERSGQIIRGKNPAGATVLQALDAMGVVYSLQDIISPGLSTVLSEDTEIHILTVTEEESKSQRIIPFISQTIRNETLPEGETYIIQSGKNGLEELTTKSVYEDNLLASQTITNRAILEESVPEILMVGVKAEHTPIQIPGKIIFVSNNSLWLMQNTTGERTPLVTTGDVDGRILDLSSDGEWLLFSRATKEDEINSLWMLNISDWSAEPISLRISNVVHFSAWLPGDALRVVYSTVIPQESAPGWKAENDLQLQVFSESGMILSKETLLEANEDGIYSWWGTQFLLSKDGKTLAYANPGSIGVIDRLTGEKTPLAAILPYEKTRSDWAWVPGISWTAEQDGLVFSFHGDISGVIETFDPTDFNLGSVNIHQPVPKEIRAGTGLFSYPSVSPLFDNGNSLIAFLEPVTPSESESSQYRILVMNADGTNPKLVFPLESGGYVSPQKISWAPESDQSQTWLAFLYQGNIWLVNPFTGIYNQITIDQSISGFIWE